MGDVHARATSSADFYKVTKCLADREASVGDLQPACAERIKTTIAGACNSELHSFCAGIEPGNKRLHACLLTNRKYLGNLCRTYIADVIPSAYLVDKSSRAGKPEKKVTTDTGRKESRKSAGKAVAEASAKAQKVQKTQAKATKADIPNVRFSSTNEMSASTGGKAKPLPSTGKSSATGTTENAAGAVGRKQQPYVWLIVVMGALGVVALAVGVAAWRSRREHETRAMYSSLMMVQPPAV